MASKRANTDDNGDFAAFQEISISNGNSNGGSTDDSASRNAVTENEIINQIVDCDRKQPADSSTTCAVVNGYDRKGDADLIEYNDPLSSSTIRTTPIDVGTDAHISSTPIEKSASTERPVLQKVTTDLEAISELEQDHSICSTPHDEDTSYGKETHVNSSEGGKVNTSRTTNTFEQEPPPHKYNYVQNNSDVELAIARAVPCDGHSDDEIRYGIKKLDVKQVATLAFERDPNEYDNKSFCRRYAMVAGGCSVLGIAIIVLLSVLLVPPKADYRTDTLSMTKVPTASPTDITRETIVINYLAQELSPKVLIKGTAYSMAADWILNYDPQQLDFDMNRDSKPLMQRFALAVFYFSSTRNGSTPWRSCNPPSMPSLKRPISAAAETNNSATENINTCTFLERTPSPDTSSIVYNEIPGKIRWLSSLHECEWQGVTCSSTSGVLGINIVGQGIQGNLGFILADSEENENKNVSNVLLQAFPFLQVMDLSYNYLTGPLPASFADFSDLNSLELQGNFLSGEIPMSLFNLTSLRTLNLGENRLSGKLDTKIGQLSELRGLHIHRNNFLGQLPSQIGKLSFLSNFRITDNMFSGTLPTEIGRLTRLIELQYANNVFVGTIPTQFGQLTSMDIFRLDSNRLSGTIPVELCNFTNLRVMMLDRNSLTGPLPTTELLQLQPLIRFQVNNNRLTGPIPGQLGDLPRLRLAWLHLNEFTGPMPNEVCEAANIPNFLQIDCAPIDNPPNPCRCCSACCDRSTEICSKLR